jgi:hypothetical protein
VLEYKNRELKGQIEPRESEIGEMRAQIADMDGELERYHRSNAGGLCCCCGDAGAAGGCWGGAWHC